MHVDVGPKGLVKATEQYSLFSTLCSVMASALNTCPLIWGTSKEDHLFFYQLK